MGDTVQDPEGRPLVKGGEVVCGDERGVVTTISDFDADHDGERFVPIYPSVLVRFDSGEGEWFSSSPDLRLAYESDEWIFTVEEVEAR